MKIKIFVVLILLTLLSSSCEHKNPSVPTAESSDNGEEAYVITDLGIAYQDISARVPWDLKLYNNCLYVGAGDYDKNISPGRAKRYNISSGNWEECGDIPDEQINRFVLLNNSLVIPGTDPTGDWSLGNYYILNNNSFQTVRKIPGGLHCFDLVTYKDKIFAGLGVLNGSFPACVSEDGGNSFKSIDFYKKDGMLLLTQQNTDIRVYDLVVLGDSLYAVLTIDGNTSIYKYSENGFTYYNNWDNKIIYTKYTYVPILEKRVIEDTLYFTTGKLYKTDDMKNLSVIEFDDIEHN